VAVFLHVPLGRLSAVVSGVVGMSVGHVGVVRGLLMVASRVVFRGLPMVLGSMLVMLGRLRVVLRRFLRHGELL
jgi:hypothetical protein